MSAQSLKWRVLIGICEKREKKGYDQSENRYVVRVEDKVPFLPLVRLETSGHGTANFSSGTHDTRIRGRKAVFGDYMRGMRRINYNSDGGFVSVSDPPIGSSFTSCDARPHDHVHTSKEEARLVMICTPRPIMK